MTCYVMLEFTVKDGLRPRILEELARALPVTRGQDGCASVELRLSEGQPDTMLIVMRRQSRKHYQAYRAWRDRVGDAARLAEATTGGLSTRFFDGAQAF